MLLSLTQEDNADVIRALRASALPMVLLDRDRPEGVKALLARFDHRLGMTAAVDHLLDLGHRDFAMVIGGPALPARDRRAAVEETLWPSGGRCMVVEGAFGVEGGYRGTLQALDRTPRPTALIAAGNTLMAGAIRALHELDIQIGTRHLVRRLRQRPGRRAASATDRRRVPRRWRPRHGRGEHVAQCAEHEPPRFARRGHGAADRVHGQAKLRPATGPIALESRVVTQRDESGVDELFGQEVEVVVQVDDRP